MIAGRKLERQETVYVDAARRSLEASRAGYIGPRRKGGGSKTGTGKKTGATRN
jgi:hypothetical protein